jgi:hypothetical protein
MNKKIIFIILLTLTLIILTGCSLLIPSQPDTGVMKGQIMVPSITKDISGWVPVANATVTMTDCEGITHTVMTDENGFYLIEEVAPGFLYCITATALVDGKTIVFKDLAEEVSAGETYNLGTADENSTALALIVEALLAEGLSAEEIDLEKIKNLSLFSLFKDEIFKIIEAHGNIDESSILSDMLLDIVNEYLENEEPSGEVPSYQDSTSPTLENLGFTADGSAMPAGTAANSFNLEKDNDPSHDYQISFAAATQASENIPAGTYALTLTGLSGVTVQDLKDYYAARLTPEPWLAYLKDAADGTEPFALIKADGSTAVTLLDGAKYNVPATPMEVPMTIPGDYPSGEYTVSGDIEDEAGNTTTVTFTLIVQDSIP